MYKDGWIACWRLDRIPWKMIPDTSRNSHQKMDPNKAVELYNLEKISHS